MESTTRKRDRSLGLHYSRRLAVYDTEEGAALLQELARRRGVSATGLVRQLVREEAARVGIAEPDATDAKPPQHETDGAETAEAATAERQQLARERLRGWVEQRRAGVELPHEAIKREVAILRAGVTITPAQPIDEARREYLRQLAAKVRRGVPEEWNDQDLLAQVQQTVNEVRRKHRAGHG